MSADKIFSLEEALRLGLKMRDAQKKYFRDRTRENLVASKQLEKEFDTLSARLVAPPGAML